MLVPSSVHVNVLFETLKLSELSQVSELPLSSSDPVNVALPPAPNSTVTVLSGTQLAVGSTPSVNSIMVVQVELLPLSSVAVRVTVDVLPRFEQSKVLGETDNEGEDVQVSVLPESILSVPSVVVPLPTSKVNVLSVTHEVVGATVSWTATLALQVEELE